LGVLSIETNIRFYYGKRWIFSYTWEMQQSYLVKGYPMTKGFSALTVAYRFVNKNKTVSN
jgi:hypothetical protein